MWQEREKLQRENREKDALIATLRSMSMTDEQATIYATQFASEQETKKRKFLTSL